MEEKSIDDKINLWSKVLSKTFPFIKGLIFDEERNHTIFIKIVMDYLEFAEYINGELRESFIYTYLSKFSGSYTFLSIPFDKQEDKDKAEQFQKNIQNYFNDIVVEHLPESYKPNKKVYFFTFVPHYEIKGK